MSSSLVVPSIFAIAAEDGAEFDREDTQNCREFLSSLNLPRSISAQGESFPQHKIAAFSRNSFIAGFKTVQDLEDYEFCDLDDCVSTVRIFPQDDCLHTEIPFCGRSRLGRARYNFQQGLLNTKEVMETKESRSRQAAPVGLDWAPA